MAAIPTPPAMPWTAPTAGATPPTTEKPSFVTTTPFVYKRQAYVPSSPCKDLYPAFCELQAKPETCGKQAVWSKCGTTCNKCSETRGLQYECKDQNQLCQTDMMQLNCATKQWVKEMCPISCQAQTELCNASTSSATQNNAPVQTQNYSPKLVSVSY